MTMNKPTIMFVDDEQHILNAMNWLFRKQYNLLFANSGETALELLKINSVDVLISDQKMPGMCGTEVLKAAKELSPDTIRILLTGYSDYNAAVSSVNEGEVFRFCQKPWKNDTLKAIVSQAVDIAQLTQTSSPAQKTISIPRIVPANESFMNASAGVLMIDMGLNTADQIKPTLNALTPSYVASSLQGAIELLENESVGVLIIEHTNRTKQNVQFIKMMKEHHPEIITIVVCENEDINDVIELINAGQVYRFLRTPIRPAMLKMSIDSGLKHHELLNKRPQLRSRYKVDTSMFSSTSLNLDDPISTSNDFSFKDLFSRIKRLGRSKDVVH